MNDPFEPALFTATHRALNVWALVSVVSAAAYYSLHSYPLQPGPADPALVALHATSVIPAQAMFLAAVTSPLALMLAAFSGLRANASRTFWVRVFVLFVVPWCAFVLGRQSAWPTTEAALSRAAARARPLIVAIERHRIARGAPPTDLDDLGLDPPGTGMRAYPEYRYLARSGGSARIELWWYDLGPRSGRSLTSQWRSADGEISNAVLVAKIDALGAVMELFADRMPVEPQNARFEQERWRREPAKRVAVVRDLLRRQGERLRTSASLIALLGEPSGKRVEEDALYELRVPSSPSDLEDPNFFYWPTRAYPDNIDGFPIRRIGDWAYRLR